MLKSLLSKFNSHKRNKNRVALGDIEKTFSKRVQVLGENFQALGWTSEKAQRTRFRELYFLAESSLGSLQGLTILDVGCGLGDFFDYLIQVKKWQGTYIGLDVSSTMIEACNRRFGRLARELSEELPEEHPEGQPKAPPGGSNRPASVGSLKASKSGAGHRQPQPAELNSTFITGTLSDPKIFEQLREKHIDLAISSGVLSHRMPHQWEFFTDTVSHMKKLAKKGVCFNCLSDFAPKHLKHSQTYVYYRPQDIKKHLKKVGILDIRFKMDYLPNDFAVFVK